ncbi:hypothetical protein [Polycladidibacter stylochi]|uniref:hypothetical protein n=1 Tax=Polycladidibacter stylochi TaxID=1807766 RepID=UPI0008348569|nr:hypothetical protein [Pseudovibrio stylochi]
MKKIDPLHNWKQPIAIEDWGRKCSPPINRAWLSHINYFVHPDIAVAIGRLLLPTFLEHDGGVFLEVNFTLDGYSKWRKHLDNISAIENMMNHQHVYDLFAVTDNISEESYLGVANLLADTTRLALKACYPERQFCVDISIADNDYGPTVSFYSR